MLVLRVFFLLFFFIAATQFLEATGNGAEPDTMADGSWQSDIVGGFTLTQAQFDNWAQGGENTLAWQINFDSNFIYRTNKHKWTNNGDFKFGQARIGGTGTRKSSDEIRIESVYQYTIGAHVNPFTSVNFQTQFARGFRYEPDTTIAVSDFMDPGYITLSAGAGSNPFEGFNTRIGGAYKITVVDQFARNLTNGEQFATEFGVSSITNYRKRLTENIRLTTRLEVFSNLVSFNDVDVRWDVVITAQVTRYIDVRLNTELFYDKSVSPKRQLKQVLSLGLSYTFI